MVGGFEDSYLLSLVRVLSYAYVNTLFHRGYFYVGLWGAEWYFLPENPTFFVRRSQKIPHHKNSHRTIYRAVAAPSHPQRFCRHSNMGCRVGLHVDTGRVVSRCYQQFFWHRYFAIRFAGFSVLRSVLLYCKLWREHIFKFLQELFFWKIPRNSFFFFKRRAKCTQRGGTCPPFFGKRGLPPIFEGLPQIIDAKLLTEFSFGMVYW